MHDGYDRTSSSFVAGVLGAMVGATIAVILSDRDRRKRLMDALDGVAEKGRELAERVGEDAKERLTDVRDEVEERADSVAKQIRKKGPLTQ